MIKRILISCSSLLLIAGHFQFAAAEPIVVKAAVFVVDLREIDGARQSFSGDVVIRLRWNDPRLAGEASVRTIPVQSAWNPNLQLVNRITVQTTLPEVLEVDPQGNVIYRQRFIGQFSCTMNLSQFPFDIQSLSLRFVAIGFSPDQVKFVEDPEGRVADQLSITDWRILGWNASGKPFQINPASRSLAGYEFTFQAKRYFLFFLVQIILPMSLILGMALIAFWLDTTQPGPRISISITSMLTVVAYRLLLGSFLPRLSYLTRMDYFVFSCTFLVFFSLVTIVYIARLTLNKQESKAQKLDSTMRWLFPTTFLLVILGCFVL